MARGVEDLEVEGLVAVVDGLAVGGPVRDGVCGGGHADEAAEGVRGEVGGGDDEGFVGGAGPYGGVCKFGDPAWQTRDDQKMR